MSRPYYRPETYRAKTAVSYLIRRAHNLILSKFETLFISHDFTFTQWVVLMHLRDDLADTCSEIARNMHHDNGALTRIVDQLEARGLVERHRCESDRRVVRLSLTPAGRKTVETLVPVATDYLNEVMDGFTKAEGDQLISLLTRLVTRIEEADEVKA